MTVKDNHVCCAAGSQALGTGTSRTALSGSLTQADTDDDVSAVLRSAIGASMAALPPAASAELAARAAAPPPPPQQQPRRIGQHQAMQQAYSAMAGERGASVRSVGTPAAMQPASSADGMDELPNPNGPASTPGSVVVAGDEQGGDPGGSVAVTEPAATAGAARRRWIVL